MTLKEDYSPQSWSEEGTEDVEGGGYGSAFCFVDVGDRSSTDSKRRGERESSEEAKDAQSPDILRKAGTHSEESADRCRNEIDDVSAICLGHWGS